MTIRCLGLLSERARSYLSRSNATQDGAFAGEPELTSLLAREGLQPWPELVAFEASFGGLCFRDGESEVKLGVAVMASIEERLRVEPEDERVAIGTDGEVDYYMDRSGQVLSHGPDRVLWPCAPSMAKYIEHLAVRMAFSEWHPDPFHITVGPRGEDVASVVGLALDDVGSDSHEAYWMSDRYILCQRLQGDWYNTSYADLCARSLQEAAEAILKLRDAMPDMSISVAGCYGSRREEYLQRETSDVPGIQEVEGWSSTGGTIRFEGEEMFGKRTILWLVPDGSGGWRMEQYDVLVDGQLVVEWSSFSAAEQWTRHYTIP